MSLLCLLLIVFFSKWSSLLRYPHWSLIQFTKIWSLSCLSSCYVSKLDFLNNFMFLIIVIWLLCVWDKNSGDFAAFSVLFPIFYYKFLYCICLMLHQMSYQKIISWSSRVFFICFIFLMLSSIFVINQIFGIFLDPSWYVAFIAFLRLSSCPS